MATNDVRIDLTRDDLEPTYVNGVQCSLVFKGALTPDTQMYLIWAVGTNGIVDTTYNTAKRPNIYAIFGTGRPAFETHHVDGFDQFDHTHVLDNPGNSTHVENATWDLLVLFPGPNFNAATYTTPKNVSQMLALSAAGILSPVMTLPDAGFPPVVLRIPVSCPGDDGFVPPN
ncbi:MAG TPA: hypothetical protein VGD80_16450 [Kofleriaceae bacterium]